MFSFIVLAVAVSFTFVLNGSLLILVAMGVNIIVYLIRNVVCLILDWTSKHHTEYTF